MFINSSTVFLTHRSIAALPHFFRKCPTIISQRDPKGAKKEKTYYKNNVCIYVHMRTFPYNISQNLIGYAVFRKHPSLSKTHTCENIESTVCKNCDPLFSLMTPNSQLRPLTQIKHNSLFGTERSLLRIQTKSKQQPMICLISLSATL